MPINSSNQPADNGGQGASALASATWDVGRHMPLTRFERHIPEESLRAQLAAAGQSGFSDNPIATVNSGPATSGEKTFSFGSFGSSSHLLAGRQSPALGQIAIIEEFVTRNEKEGLVGVRELTTPISSSLGNFKAFVADNLRLFLSKPNCLICDENGQQTSRQLAVRIEMVRAMAKPNGEGMSVLFKLMTPTGEYVEYSIDASRKERWRLSKEPIMLEANSFGDQCLEQVADGGKDKGATRTGILSNPNKFHFRMLYSQPALAGAVDNLVQLLRASNGRPADVSYQLLHPEFTQGSYLYYQLLRNAKEHIEMHREEIAIRNIREDLQDRFMPQITAVTERNRGYLQALNERSLLERDRGAFAEFPADRIGLMFDLENALLFRKLSPKAYIQLSEELLEIYNVLNSHSNTLCNRKISEVAATFQEVKALSHAEALQAQVEPLTPTSHSFSNGSNNLTHYFKVRMSGQEVRFEVFFHNPVLNSGRVLFHAALERPHTVVH